MSRALFIFGLAIIFSAGFLKADEGFVSLFDGKSLAGWEARDASYWTIEDGAITGRISPEHPCKENQYLVWSGSTKNAQRGEVTDFELKLKSRLNGTGAINNGFQFRARRLADGDMCGYQVDNNLQTPWQVRLYDEFGRHTLAWRGEKATTDAQGKLTVAKIPDANGPAWFKLEEWHEYHLICVGNRISLRVDGRLAAELEDGDPRRVDLSGLIGLQLHSGPPTVVQFKDIQLKSSDVRLNIVHNPKVAAPQIDPFQDAVAHWPLATAGHGLKPALRHIPMWEKFEMDVRSAGNGAELYGRRFNNILLLDGAYLDAGLNLHAGPDAATIYLRCCDQRGAWNSALMAKRGSHETLHFNLFSVDLKETPGPDIGFEIRTDRGFAMVSFPVSQIAATAWHDLVGRYDGQTLSIYCDGKRLAAKPWSGKLQANQEPLLIGAETDAGKVVRHFHGEMAEAGLWSRALSEEEILNLGSPTRTTALPSR